MIGFVDDTYGATYSDSPHMKNISDILEYAQHDAQLWTDLLAATGGALEPSKCKYHAVTFRFSSGGAPVMQNTDIGQQHRLMVCNPTTGFSGSL